MDIVYNFIVVILIMNSLFWSFFTHKNHCIVAKFTGIKNDDCPSHIIHIIFGILCFILAVIIQQRHYIFRHYI